MNLEFATEISLRATPAAVWRALVDPALVAQYHLARLQTLEPHPGGLIVYATDGEEMITGRVVELAPEKRLAHTFRFSPSHEATRHDPETLVTYSLAATPAGTTLSLLHSGFPGENQTFANISGGWPFILQGLKTCVERNEVSQT